MNEKLDKLYKESQISGSAMTKWERDFIKSVYKKVRSTGFLSAKQEEVVDGLYNKMRFE